MDLADAAHSIPALHRCKSALDGLAHTPRPGVVELLPGLKRVAGVLDLPGDPIDQPARFERLAQSRAVIRLVGEIALLVALDPRFAQSAVVHVDRGHFGLGASPLPSSTARCAL
jgi:hypothetical protein